MENVALPSVAEILAATHILSTPNAISTIVKVGGFAVKYGRRVTLIEADNMKYPSSSAVPVPKFYASTTAPGIEGVFIIMEYIEGQTVDRILPSLSLTERQDVFDQIQESVSHLRNLPPPDYLGSIGRRPFYEGVFNTEPPIDNRTSGPFTCQDEMNEGILRRLAENCVPSHLKLLRTVIKSTLCNHRTVFTHADLQPKNIIIRRTGTKQDGNRIFDIKIIDWEMSGWYPEFWEFCSATVWDGYHPEWLEGIQSILSILRNT